MKRSAILFSLLVALAVPARAAELLIPAVYRGDGAQGTRWRTELVITNTIRTTWPQQVAVRFYAADGATHVRNLTLEPRQSMVWRDVLPELFGVQNGGGIVTIKYDDTPSRLTARARVYNVTPNGEYGQSIRGLDLDQLLYEGELIGLSNTNGNRTNFGLANPSAYPVVAWLSLVAADGQNHGLRGVEVPARSVLQLNDVFSSFLTSGTFDGAYIHFQAAGPLYAYASVVRADSGDASFVEAQ